MTEETKRPGARVFRYYILLKKVLWVVKGLLRVRLEEQSKCTGYISSK